MDISPGKIYSQNDPEVQSMIEEMKKDMVIHKREKIVTSVKCILSPEDLDTVVDYIYNYNFIYEKSINNNNKFLYLVLVCDDNWRNALLEHLGREIGGIDERTGEGGDRYIDIGHNRVIHTIDPGEDFVFCLGDAYELSILYAAFDRIFDSENMILCFSDFNANVVGDIVSKYSGEFGNNKTRDDLLCVPFHTMVEVDGKYLAILSDSMGISPNFSISYKLFKELGVYQLFTPELVEGSYRDIVRDVYGSGEYMIDSNEYKRLSVSLNIHDLILRAGSSPYIDTIKIGTNVFYHDDVGVVMNREYHKYLRRMLFRVFPMYWDTEDVVKNEIIEEISGDITGFKDREVVYTDSVEKRNGVLTYDTLPITIEDIRSIFMDTVEKWDEEFEEKGE